MTRERLRALGKYLYEVAAAFSQLLNTILGGERDQTFSARIYEATLVRKPWAGVMRRIVNGLWFWQRDHVKSAYHADSEHTYLPDD